jgi:preprotein translocase subunit YajC
MDGMMQIGFFVLIIGVFYFLLIRPQRKKEKQVTAMRNAIKAGDKITTIGGIKGTVVKAKDDVLTLQVGADRVKLEIMRWAVSRVDEEKAVKKEKDTDDEDKSEESIEQAEEKTTARKPRKLTAKTADTENEDKEKSATAKKPADQESDGE